jgi:hypothetical protein
MCSALPAPLNFSLHIIISTEAIAMKKIDYKKEFKHLYNPPWKEVAFISVPAMKFLMIDGKGDPNTSKDYQDAIEALFSVSYTLKFMVKKGKLQVDYGVLPLEGLWWMDDTSQFSIDHKDKWKWTSMIMQPDYITQEMVKAAIDQVNKKKKLAALSLMRFENYNEGEAAQIMHIGPFSDEGANIEKVHSVINEKGYQLAGKHHEIYLSDFRRTAPEKLKTIIRQPIKQS